MSLKKMIVMAFLASFAITGQLIASSCHASGGSHKHKSAEEKTATKGTQKICPIGKKEIDPDSFIEFQGQKVYFCCPGCDKKFLKDPDLYFGQMKERGEVTENIQTLCPVSGDKLDEDKVSLTLPGRKIFFCCKKCVRQFKKDKAKYIKNLDKKAESEKEEGHKGDGHKGHDHSAHKSEKKSSHGHSDHNH